LAQPAKFTARVAESLRINVTTALLAQQGFRLHPAIWDDNGVMVQFTIMIAERDGAVSLHFTRGYENPTKLEAALLEEECRIGFARHSDALQKLALRSLRQLRSSRDTGNNGNS